MAAENKTLQSFPELRAYVARVEAVNAYPRRTNIGNLEQLHGIGDEEGNPLNLMFADLAALLAAHDDIHRSMIQQKAVTIPSDREHELLAVIRTLSDQLRDATHVGRCKCWKCKPHKAALVVAAPFLKA
jgi:hypothetical protein